MLYTNFLLVTAQVYFVKKTKEPVPKDVPVKNAIMYGDISYSPIDQLSAFVDEVCDVIGCSVFIKSSGCK